MRPAEVGPALVKAAQDYVIDLNRQISQAQGTPDGRRGATLAELAAAACVGRQTARDLVPKLKSRGHLEIVGERRVAYCNKPVKEYAPAMREPELAQTGPALLAGCLQGWAR